LSSQQHESTFQGIDENMELDQEDQAELMKFETVQTSKEIEFDKIKISDVRRARSAFLIFGIVRSEE
jgi:hypothetical protein